MKKIVLVGMPGCGKTQIGLKTAELLGLSFIDIDDLIEQSHGPITGIFENEGEEKFREYETNALKNAVSGDWVMISAGGGIVEKIRNRKILSAHNVIFIDREPGHIEKTLEDSGRPLLKGKPGALQKLYKRRYSLYLETMDFHIKNNGTEDECIEKTAEIAAHIISGENRK